MSEIAPRQVVIVGGGITGLAAAHRLVELASEEGDARAPHPPVQVTLLEAGPQLGGVIRTTRQDGYIIEAGPDNFITNKPAGIQLAERLGLSDQLIRTNDAHRSAMVVHRGRLVPLPEGFMMMAPSMVWPMVTTPLMSWPGKLRMAMELTTPVRPGASETDDESLASFVRRRLGRETLDRLIQPLIGGIYTADAEKLSLRATLPRFLDMEREHGSLIRAMRKAAKKGRPSKADQPSGASQANAANATPKGDTGARYSLFVTFKQGMSTLVERLAEAIGPDRIRTQSPVQSLTPLPQVATDASLETAQYSENNTQHRWRVDLADGSHLLAHDVILTTAAYRAADLIRGFDATLAGQLEAIEYASSAVAQFAFRREQITHPLNSFGFVVPHIEGRGIVAGSFSSVKYAGRAPEGCVLLRAFMGGALNANQMSQDDDHLTATALAELGDLLGIEGQPIWSRLSRWRRAMPQYHVGHLDRVASLMTQARKHPGLWLAGSAYEGVGVPDCIAQGEAAAEALHAA